MDEAPRATHREQVGLEKRLLLPGQSITARTRRTVTDFDNVAAALLAMNTHPAHSDYAYAATTQFKKPLVVSPLLLSCVIAGVMNELRDIAVEDLEIQALSFMRPVHPGETISGRATVETSGPTQIALKVEGVKAEGEVFAQFRLLLRTVAQPS